MLNKKLIPVAVPLVALILLVAAIMSVGAQPKQAVNVPAGAIVDSPNAVMANDTPKKAVPDAPALPTAAQPGAVTESFDSASLDNWRGTSESTVQWVAKDGRLQKELPASDGPSSAPALFVSKDTGFSDGTIETFYYATSGEPVGIVLRGSDAGYYRVVLYMNVSTNTASKARIERITPAGTEVVATAPFSAFAGYKLEQWQHLLVSAQGNTISVSVDGNQIMSATDSSFASGWAGVWAVSDRGASFDNLRIQRNAGR
ncbi:MAG: family 16 glycoside hydrolase [Chloroflexota bacterium]